MPNGILDIFMGKDDCMHDELVWEIGCPITSYLKLASR
jgi:hypothetical protein